MHVGLKQPRRDREHCITPARAATKETRRKATLSSHAVNVVLLFQFKSVLGPLSKIFGKYRSHRVDPHESIPLRIIIIIR